MARGGGRRAHRTDRKACAPPTAAQTRPASEPTRGCPSRSWRPPKCHLFVAWTLMAGSRHVTLQWGIFGSGGGACVASPAPCGSGTGSLDARSAAGAQVWHHQLLFPLRRGPKGDSTPKDLPQSQTGGQGQWVRALMHLPLGTGLASVTSHPCVWQQLTRGPGQPLRG